MKDAALRVEDLSVWRGRSEIVRSVDLTIPTGGLVALVGSNGAGKTTLIEGVLGRLVTRSSSFEVLGSTVRRHRPWDLVRSGLVVVPQERWLFAEMTVEENLDIVVGRREAEEQFSRADVLDLFPRLGERRHQPAGTLSGGERSMLAMARGLSLQPRLLVLDEPSLGLAPIVVESIMRTIAEISSTGLPILLVEQNVHQALAMASSAYVLDSGTFVFSGPSKELAESDILSSGFLGIA